MRIIFVWNAVCEERPAIENFELCHRHFVAQITEATPIRVQTTPWISNHIHCYIYDVITHPYTNFNGDMTELAVSDYIPFFYLWFHQCHFNIIPL